jgi:tetratricopeptide (TPR) repeat protein
MPGRPERPTPREPAPRREGENPSDSPPPRDDLATMKAEIDALQISAAEKTKPWYLQASVLIALLALVFSLGTTYYSYKRTHQQDVHNAKVELRGLIQRLTALPVQNLDLDKKYKDDSYALIQAGSFLNTEAIVLAKQAVDIVDQIPDEVSATEYYAVATVLAQAGEYGRTLGLYERALDTSEDINDFTGAARALGATAFTVGDATAGRDAFHRALDAFKRFPTKNVYFRDLTNSYTELAWARAEVLTKHCAESAEHLNRATAMLSALDKEDMVVRRYSAELAATQQQARKICSL